MKSKMSSGTLEQETAVEAFDFDVFLLYRSTVLFAVANRSDKTPVELFLRFCAEINDFLKLRVCPSR
jgi:hypothetical protein